MTETKQSATRVSRRQVLQGAAAVPLSGISRASAGEPGLHRRPNILFILADDLGFADLSCYGRREYRTETIDGLASSGLRFVSGYANSAVCSATRIALLTGRYQYQFRAGREEPIADPVVSLPAHVPTLPLELKRLGYRTALIGKWHAGKSGPNQHGYDYFFGFKGGGVDYFKHRTISDKGLADDGLFEQSKSIERQGYLTDILAKNAVKWIEADSRAPFFLSLHFSAPHWPWEGPNDEARSRSLSDIFDKSGGSLATFGDMVVSMDSAISRVIDALERNGQRNNTIIVFTSDNGGERYSDTWPLSGMKGELFEGGIRVPLIISWPAMISEARITSQVMASMDFMPTLLAAASGNSFALSTVDGMNLLPMIIGSGERDIPRRIFWRYKLKGQAAVRSGDWKYLRFDGKEHLFNVVSDPRERADKKDELPVLFKRLRTEWQRWNSDMAVYEKSSYSYDISEVAPDQR